MDVMSVTCVHPAEVRSSVLYARTCCTFATVSIASVNVKSSNLFIFLMFCLNNNM